MTNELKACPFCAGGPILNHIEPHSHSLMFNGEPIMPDYPGSWTIECCDVGMIKDTREEAIAAWNRRAPVERQAPEGFAIVPLEPTPEMLDVYQQWHRDGKGYMDISIYKAVIAAAPSADRQAEAKAGEQ